uniref:Elongation factor 1-beta n=1 Tax=Anthurium amnicola TaxID=1678845 RepID=A0A1D1Y4L3_9ARAE
MVFTNLDKNSGLGALNTYLEDKSYISGYEPTQADVSVFTDVGKAPDSTKYPHAARWYAHISSYSPLPKGEIPSKIPTSNEPEDDDEDVDLFGSDDEEDAEAEKLKAQRLAEYQAKKAAKPKVIAKSVVTLDVKPWDDTTNMKELEALVKGVEMDGLVWGTSKLMPVGYGINKLQINCVIEDDKVGVDDLDEKITAFEDYVQSVDVAAFQKL